MAWPKGQVQLWRHDPNHLSVAKLIELIPNDGCLLVFNADHPNWRSRVCEHGAGMLRCHAVGGEHYQRTRDLYITWREDL